MEKRKTPVVKSNSTSEAKKNISGPQEHNKKSRSSAEFQAKMTVTGGFQPLKRRGVYVEKKSIKIPINIDGVRSSHASSSPRVLSHRIRRPDKKRFLANILTLLSKSTAGTQCSGPNSNEELSVESTRQKMKKKREEEAVFNDSVTFPSARRARAWKTKNFNNHVDGEIDSLIVLQSTREIIQTPSNNSECISLLHRNADSTLIEPNMDWAAPCPPSDRQDLNDTLAKASHGKSTKLISSEKETGFEANQNEKDVYNFFVDVLKTTLSACNIKQHTDGRPLCTNSSNVSLEIDEVVAEKLKMQDIKDSESKENIIENEPKAPYKELYMPPCNAKCYYSVMPYETQEWGENFKPEFSKQTKVELTKKRKKQRIISNSLQYRARPASTSNRSRPVPNKTTSMSVPPPKKIPIKLKVNSKRNFIHSIKQELQFDKEDVYEKPNFFQALKTMAKNKKKQSVNFRTSRRPSDENVCQLKSRNVLSAESNSKKQPKKTERWQIAVVPNTRQPNFSGYNRQAPITIYETSSEESMNSNYSLEVTGYEDKSVVKSHVPAHLSPVAQEFSSPSFRYSDN